ncbi:MAG: hypothetical protein PVJ05_10235 [Candidatus Thorarchaeota archaeon]|jgi:hypothetical protein
MKGIEELAFLPSLLFFQRMIFPKARKSLNRFRFISTQNLLSGDSVVGIPIPLGAQSPISGWWEKCVGIAAVIFVLILVALLYYPPLIVLISVGVVLLLLVVYYAACMGLYDSARESLEYSDSLNIRN